MQSFSYYYVAVLGLFVAEIWHLYAIGCCKINLNFVLDGTLHSSCQQTVGRHDIHFMLYANTSRLLLLELLLMRDSFFDLQHVVGF